MYSAQRFSPTAALWQLSEAANHANVDVRTTVQQTRLLIEKFKAMKRGHKEPSERLAAGVTEQTLALVVAASAYGVKKFLEEVEPFGAFQMQLRFVDACLNHLDVSPVASIFHSRAKVEEQINSLIGGLQAASDELLTKLQGYALTDSVHFDLYEEKLVASGGYADIHIGTWRPLDVPDSQRVAVKHLRPKGIDLLKIGEMELQDRMLKRLFREVEAWKDLRHPHILPLLHYSRHPRLVLLTPWCENGHVMHYLSRNPGADRVALAAQAAIGLNFLHTLPHPVVHADIKPENMLINDQGEVVLADFGQARILNGLPSPWITDGLVHGTTVYMAPELHQDNTTEVSLASDVYAFTMATLYLLSGRPPFDHIRTHIVLYVEQGHRPRRQDHPDAACQSLWGLLELGWHAIPSQRPPMHMFVRRLTDLADGRRRYPMSAQPQHSSFSLPSPMHHEYSYSSLNSNSHNTRSIWTPGRSLTTSALQTRNSAAARRQEDNLLLRNRCIYNGDTYDVWEGTWQPTPRSPSVLVAIKCLRRHSAGHRTRDFDRERRAWTPLQHQNILPLLYASITSYTLVATFCSNNISTYLAARPAIDPLTLLVQVADALDYLHTGPNPIVHGEVRPDNIYVDENGVPLLAGFGNALTDQELGTETVWEIAQERPADRYTAPEILNGFDWSFKSDVYAFGMVAVEVLSAMPPFPSLVCSRLLRAIANGSIPSGPQHRDWRGHCEALWPVFEGCWVYDPVQRLTARDVRAALEARLYSSDAPSGTNSATSTLRSFPTPFR